jgi:hypothetical protein
MDQDRAGDFMTVEESGFETLFGGRLDHDGQIIEDFDI